MKKLTDSQFNILQDLIEEFLDEHTYKQYQTIQQFKAWLEVNQLVNNFLRKEVTK